MRGRRSPCAVVDKAVRTGIHIRKLSSSSLLGCVRVLRRGVEEREEGADEGGVDLVGGRERRQRDELVKPLLGRSVSILSDDGDERSSTDLIQLRRFPQRGELFEQVDREARVLNRRMIHAPQQSFTAFL